MKSADFRAITADPLNGSPTPDALIRAPITPAELFFVRNHGAVPEPGAEPWNVRVHGKVGRALDLKLEDFRKFPRVTVESTLQCAGNRRTGLERVRHIENELAWGSEAIGTAKWEGVQLSVLLDLAQAHFGGNHVWFLGADKPAGKITAVGFGGSIPIDKAMHADTIVADTMNGAPLPAEHGAPIRVIVPGYIGARSVKWLRDIRIEIEPSPNHYHAAYSFIPGPDAHPLMETRVLDEFPLSSAFANPIDGATVPAGRVTVRGWAIAGGERTVSRVEVSTSRGASWATARFTSPAKRYVWRLWEADVTLPPGEQELICRATDNRADTQPDGMAAIWNAKGYVNNCWDRIRITAIGD